MTDVVLVSHPTRSAYQFRTESNLGRTISWAILERLPAWPEVWDSPVLPESKEKPQDSPRWGRLSAGSAPPAWSPLIPLVSPSLANTHWGRSCRIDDNETTRTPSSHVSHFQNLLSLRKRSRALIFPLKSCQKVAFPQFFTWTLRCLKYG